VGAARLARAWLRLALLKRDSHRADRSVSAGRAIVATNGTRARPSLWRRAEIDLIPRRPASATSGVKGRGSGGIKGKGKGHQQSSPNSSADK